MKTHSTQQEILLLTGTSFAARQYSEKNGGEDDGRLTDNDRLQAACWNGLLPEMLPELVQQPENGRQLYLWQVFETTAFLELELGENDEPKEKCYSIDPYTFLATEVYN